MDNWEKHVRDWDISGREANAIERQFKNINLLKIVFPEFWHNAYRNKNNFYKHVFLEAEQHIEKGVCGKEWIEKGCFQKLWQRHCDFCMKSIETDLQEECYCSKDAELWVCAHCYKDYMEHFGWTAKQIDDIHAENIEKIVGLIIAKE
jgi:hypothetical protein